MDKKLEIILAARDMTGKAFQSTMGRVKGLTSNILSLKTAMVGLAVTGVGAFVKSQIDSIDTIGKTADKLGLSVEALQEYRYAAELAGIEHGASGNEPPSGRHHCLSAPGYVQTPSNSISTSPSTLTTNGDDEDVGAGLDGGSPCCLVDVPSALRSSEFRIRGLSSERVDAARRMILISRAEPLSSTLSPRLRRDSICGQGSGRRSS